MTFFAFMVTSLFAIDNKVFFDTVEQNKKDGFTWEYVGKQTPDGSPAITTLDAQNNEVIYFKMTK
jgi:hypothetical protein